MADNDINIQSLLDMVLLNASKMDTKQNKTSKEGSLKKEQHGDAGVKGISELPIDCKLKILSLLSGDLKDETNSSQKSSTSISLYDNSQLLPPVTFIKHNDLKIQMQMETHLKFFTARNLETLDSKGYFLFDNFLNSKEEAELIHSEAESLFPNLASSSMSRGDESWRDNKIRGDKILWLNQRWKVKESHPHIYNLLLKMDSLREELNQACDFSSEHTQTHLACYPGEGARYVRHLDATVGGSARRLTLLYYFNTQWQKDHGGELRLYDEHAPNGYVDVEPIADRLVVFQSRVVEHEG